MNFFKKYKNKKQKKNNEPKSHKLRFDLIIFGVLIYILGIFTGIFLGVAVSEGDVSASSFQRFFSSEDEIVVEDVSPTEIKEQVEEVIIPDEEVDKTSVIVSGGSGSSTVTSGGEGSSSVSKTNIEESTSTDSRGSVDDENVILDNTPIDYVD